MSATLVLRLAGPLQSWGSVSQFNRRESAAEPTKSGILGLLAAAKGLRRADPIEDLLALHLAVRTDQPGNLLRDYHTVSDYRGRPLLSASVKATGEQKPNTAGKLTHVTHRYYLQDAVFTAAVTGSHALLGDLADAIRRPAFPLALGRRSCPPTQPLYVPPPPQQAHSSHRALWAGHPMAVLAAVPWQASPDRRTALGAAAAPRILELPVVLDDPAGDDVRNDLPRSFSPSARGFATRRVRNAWVKVDNPDGQDQAPPTHDPFALLGW